MSDQPSTKNEKLAQHAILYSDGSAKPRNPGVIGWSVHGYTFTSTPTTKGAGHPKVVPTSAGYLEKSAASVPVDLVNYYDYLGWRPEVTTNNEAEVRGCLQALKYATTMPYLKTVTVFSDSRYTVDGLNNHLPNWVSNNWRKRDGNPVQHSDIWKEALAVVDTLAKNNTKISVRWVKGHGTDFGNIRADQLASIASEIALTATTIGEKETISESSGYWKTEAERHPLMGLRGWFFLVDKDQKQEGEYYLCNQVKSDEFIGRRDVDGAFGYVQLSAPDALMEIVRKRQIEEARSFQTLALARIDRIYDKAVCAAIESHGTVVLRCRRSSNNLHFINEDAMVQPAKGDSGADKAMPVTEELYPPKLALRCVDTVSGLISAVKAFQTNEQAPELVDSEFFDITNTYYTETTDKKGNAVTAFRKDIAVSDQSILVRRTAFGKELDFQQIFGIHILARNNMKRLEGTDVKVWLVVQKQSPRALRYYTVIRSNQDWSAWSGAHSNLIVFKENLQ